MQTVTIKQRQRRREKFIIIELYLNHTQSARPVATVTTKREFSVRQHFDDDHHDKSHHSASKCQKRLFNSLPRTILVNDVDDRSICCCCCSHYSLHSSGISHSSSERRQASSLDSRFVHIDRCVHTRNSLKRALSSVLK